MISESCRISNGWISRISRFSCLLEEFRVSKHFIDFKDFQIFWGYGISKDFLDFKEILGFIDFPDSFRFHEFLDSP